MRRIIYSFLVLTIIPWLGMKPIPDHSDALSKFRNEFLNRVNKVRQAGCHCGSTYMPPAEPLKWNNLLESSAYKHALDMYRKKYFSHTSLSGKTIKNRIEEAGYTLTGMRSYAVGENIASGQNSINEVMDGWLKSEGHCKNIMNRSFKEFGVAETHLYWVQDFGMRVERNPI